jgi:dTDP-4-dehydrorhamnose reductase
MNKILVTGGNGQLANCIKDADSIVSNYSFVYVDINDLDITNELAVSSYFKSHDIAYCINCAAYTAVDQAETNIQVAKNANVKGAEVLAKACKEYNTVLIQISTDFVFDGAQGKIYSELDTVNPLGVYGKTKLEGENVVARTIDNHFIIRTSWLYSEHGNNFVKTMLRFAKERDVLNIVNDQVGTPTYAGDLAQVILKIIATDSTAYGVYHYSNEGVASWYDFAKAIFDLSNSDIELNPILTEAYPTPAKRPSFSVMDKSKIKSALFIKIPYWRDSLKVCLSKLNLIA